MKRKIILICLIVTALISLVACGKEKPHTHNYSKHQAVLATCQTEGLEEYYTCSGCELIFDKDKKVIDKVPTIGVSDHAFVERKGFAASCVSKGEEDHYTCENCDKLFNMAKMEIDSVEIDYDFSNHVEDATLNIVSNPHKTTYAVGESFDYSGMTVVSKCSACEGSIIDGQFLTVIYQTEGANNMRYQDDKVTLAFNGLSVDINVTVEKIQATISGVLDNYQTNCGVAPYISAVANDNNLDVVIKYFDGEREVLASEFMADKTYTVKVFIEETDVYIGVEQTATVIVNHSHLWIVADGEEDRFIKICKCGDGGNVSVYNNMTRFVDDSDMSINFAKLVVGTSDVSVESIKKVTLDGEIDITPTNVNGLKYSFSKNDYNITEWTPYELYLSVQLKVDGSTVTISYVSKYANKVIRSANDLKVLAYTGDPSVNGIVTKGYFVLDGDIDASGVAFNNSKPCWSAHSGFQGIFDGQGYTISNLTVSGGQGLFGAVGLATIKNVKFTNVKVTSEHALAFCIRNSTIQDVYFEFAETSKSFLIAYSINDSVIENLTVKTRVDKGNPFLIGENAKNELPSGVTLTYYTYFTVNFDTEGGTDYDPVFVADGGVVARPSVNPTKKTDDAYWTFVDWTYNGEVWDFSSPVTEDMTIVALWDVVSKEQTQTLVNTVKEMINNLPSTVKIPDNMYFVDRILSAKNAYDKLDDDAKLLVDNYAKLEGLLSSIKGYETVKVQSLTDVSVIPSYVPNYTSSSGGSASVRQDDLMGNVLTVTSNADGVAAIRYTNNQSVAKYSKLYFFIRVLGESCNIYCSDGIANNGWGLDWKNSWSLDGFWVNSGTWGMITIDVSSGMYGSEFAIGLRTREAGVVFEITDIYGQIDTIGTAIGLTFGNFVDSGTTNEYGTVYNFTQGWDAEKSLGAFNPNVLKNNVLDGHNALHFWIYNPNSTDVTLYVQSNETGENTDIVVLKANAWTEVVFTADIIAINSVIIEVKVSQGARTAGWKISAMYSFFKQ